MEGVNSVQLKPIIHALADSIPESVEISALTLPKGISDSLCDLLGGTDKDKAHEAFKLAAVAVVHALSVCMGKP